MTAPVVLSVVPLFAFLLGFVIGDHGARRPPGVRRQSRVIYDGTVRRRGSCPPGAVRGASIPSSSAGPPPPHKEAA